MSSIQQVAMAAVCLVAAFAFGSFINQSQNDQTAQGDSTSPDGLRSLTDDASFEIQKVPGTTPQMKPKLSARLPMPSLSSDVSLPNQSFTGIIPPPSDMSGRLKPSPDSIANSFSTPSEPSGMVPDTPSFAHDVIGESAMPVVNQPNFGSSPNLADSMRAPLRADNQAPTAENVPVFAVAESNPQLSSTDQFNSQPNQPLSAPAIKQAPTFPNLNRNLNQRPQRKFVAAKPAMASITDDAGSTTIQQPRESFKSATREQFRYSNQQRSVTNGRDQNNLMPIPSNDQIVTIGDPGGAFGNRDSSTSGSYQNDPRGQDTQSNWTNPRTVLDTSDRAYYPEQTQRPQTQPQLQRRVARLPLQLNQTAQSKLTRLRDNKIQKISLSTTQFSEHVVKRGESLQSIATEHFGKPDYYLDIYLANRDRLRFPGDLRDGMSIKIPVYE